MCHRQKLSGEISLATWAATKDVGATRTGQELRSSPEEDSRQ